MNDSFRFGITVGAAIALVGHFATRGSGTADMRILVFWALIGAGVGLLVALAHVRSTRPEEEEYTVGGMMTSASEKRQKPTTQTVPKFYAISRTPSSSEMRALMVDAPTIPGNPISSRLQLIVERYDHHARVALDEDLLSRPVDEIRERATELAREQAPISGEKLDFVLTYLRSEGPLDERGGSPDGWTFKFTDGKVGIGCGVVVTATDVVLLYRTAVSYPDIPETEWIPPEEALAAVRRDVPAMRSRPLFLRVNFPSDYHIVSRNPLALVDVGYDEGEARVIGAELLPEVPETADFAPLDVRSLVESLQVDADATLTTTLRTGDAAALRALAKRLMKTSGPSGVDVLVTAISNLDDDEQEVRETLLHILSLLPTALTLIALDDLANRLPSPSSELARKLWDRRRRHELDVFPDPVEQMDFEHSRALLGRVDCQRMGLISTYDPEGDLLPELERIGLMPMRVRHLSGDTEVFLSAYLRSADGRSEALLSSSPLPVPCHVLRIVGPESETLAERVRASSAHYPESDILEDVTDRGPNSLHRGALYMAALSVAVPEAFGRLAKAVDQYRSNNELRRACLAALGNIDHPDVDTFLEGIDEPELLGLANELKSRRRAATDPPADPASQTSPHPESAPPEESPEA